MALLAFSILRTHVDVIMKSPIMMTTHANAANAVKNFRVPN